MATKDSTASKKIRGVYEHPRGSGKWYAQYFDQFGKRHREFAGAQALAIAVYQKRKTEIREQRFFPKDRFAKIRFGEICDDFKKAKPRHWSIGDGINRGTMWDTMHGWFPDLPAPLLTAQRITVKLNELEADGRTPATANRYRSILSAICSWAVRNGKMESNPVRNVAARREAGHRIRFLEPAEETELRACIEANWPDREPEFTLALNTGIRRGEMLSLMWSDVDLERGFIYLRNTKAGKPRAVPLNDDAKKALRTLRSFRKNVRVCAGHPRWWFDRAIAKANIQDFTWHDLRHTFASRLVMADVNLKTVQELLGHKTIQMTMRYAHLSPSHLKAAVDAISSGAGATKPAKPMEVPAIPTATAKTARIAKSG